MLLEADQVPEMTKASLHLLWGRAEWCHAEQHFCSLHPHQPFTQQHRAVQMIKMPQEVALNGVGDFVSDLPEPD